MSKAGKRLIAAADEALAMAKDPNHFSARVDAGAFMTPEDADRKGGLFHALWTVGQQQQQAEMSEDFRSALERIAEIPSSGFARQTAKDVLARWPR